MGLLKSVCCLVVGIVLYVPPGARCNCSLAGLEKTVSEIVRENNSTNTTSILLTVVTRGPANESEVPDGLEGVVTVWYTRNDVAPFQGEHFPNVRTTFNASLEECQTNRSIEKEALVSVSAVLGGLLIALTVALAISLFVLYKKHSRVKSGIKRDNFSTGRNDAYGIVKDAKGTGEAGEITRSVESDDIEMLYSNAGYTPVKAAHVEKKTTGSAALQRLSSPDFPPPNTTADSDSDEIEYSYTDQRFSASGKAESSAGAAGKVATPGGGGGGEIMMAENAAYSKKRFKGLTKRKKTKEKKKREKMMVSAENTYDEDPVVDTKVTPQDKKPTQSAPDDSSTGAEAKEKKGKAVTNRVSVLALEFESHAQTAEKK
jgi:hypothetical protein